MWCLPTGFAEAGESIESAAIRELKEETSIQGEILNLIDVDSCQNILYGDLLFLTFEAEHISGTPKPGSDAIGAKFFPLNKIPRLAFQSNTRAIDSYRNTKSDQWAIVDSFNLASRFKNFDTRYTKFLSDGLVRVVEKNSEEIVRLWIEDVTTHSLTSGYRRLNPIWMLKGVSKILSHFGKWLDGYIDKDIQTIYIQLGKGSKREGLLLSEVISSWGLLRKHIWEYTIGSLDWTKPVDIYMVLELGHRFVSFFEKAIYYTVKGYEDKI